MITLEGLLQTIYTTKPMTINLYDEKNLLLISFNLAGYNALDDYLMSDTVTRIEINNTNSINITIDTSTNIEIEP